MFFLSFLSSMLFQKPIQKFGMDVGLPYLNLILNLNIMATTNLSLEKQIQFLLPTKTLISKKTDVFNPFNEADFPNALF